MPSLVKSAVDKKSVVFAPAFELFKTDRKSHCFNVIEVAVLVIEEQGDMLCHCFIPVVWDTSH